MTASTWKTVSTLAVVGSVFGFIWLEFQPRSDTTVLAASTPIDAGPTTVAAADGSLIFCPNTWGDYLLWISNSRARVFATSHAHVIPVEVWEDYLTVSRGKPEALAKLDAYEVRVILLGHRRAALEALLQRSDNWQLKATTQRASVFVRNPNVVTKEDPQ